MTALIIGAWIAGTLGSAHCLAMCSGIAGTLATASGPGGGTSLILLHNAGRIISYSIAGAALAWTSRSAGLALGVANWADWLRLIAAIMLFVLGLQLITNWHLLRWIERGGGAIWRLISPLARRLAPADRPGKALGLGLLWGWLPCGLVYSVLPIAASAGNPASGALVMAAFGLGTAPVMVASGKFAGIIKASHAKHVRIAGGLLIVLGLAAAWLPLLSLLSGDNAHHH